MNNYSFGIILIGYILCQVIGCRKEYNCEDDGTCGTVYILAKVTPSHDTIQVGDTIAIEAQIPDSYFQLNGTDTTWIAIDSVYKASLEINLARMDTTQMGNLDQLNYFVERIPVVGANNLYDWFTTTYPHRILIKYVFKLPGVYFFQTGRNPGISVNHQYHPAIIEWDVPFKNFDLLNPLKDTCKYCPTKDFENADLIDEINTYPFVVLP